MEFINNWAFRLFAVESRKFAPPKRGEDPGWPGANGAKSGDAADDVPDDDEKK